MAKTKKSIKKKIIAAFNCSLLAIILIWSAVIFCYYGHYKSSKTAIKIENATDTIDIMSCNVRCLNPQDVGKRSWFYRADLLLKNIEKYEPSIIGFQEVTKWQYAYLTDCLEGFDSVIEYRDGSTFSEGCPVFYRTDLYTLADKGSFWLSETPDEMSKDWGAACYRICSYVILEQKSGGQKFVVFNTHLDHISDEARIKGIGVVLDKISQFGSLPSVIMGDFNAEEDSETYRRVTENFLDAKYQTENTDSGCTYQGFGEQLDREAIDYFMISKTGWKVESFKIVTDTFDGVYASDHFQIMGKFSLEESE